MNTPHEDTLQQPTIFTRLGGELVLPSKGSTHSPVLVSSFGSELALSGTEILDFELFTGHYIRKPKGRPAVIGVRYEGKNMKKALECIARSAEVAPLLPVPLLPRLQATQAVVVTPVQNPLT